jgi:hypothetical protein
LAFSSTGAAHEDFRTPALAPLTGNLTADQYGTEGRKEISRNVAR